MKQNPNVSSFFNLLKKWNVHIEKNHSFSNDYKNQNIKAIVSFLQPIFSSSSNSSCLLSMIENWNDSFHYRLICELCDSLPFEIYNPCKEYTINKWIMQIQKEFYFIVHLYKFSSSQVLCPDTLQHMFSYLNESKEHLLICKSWSKGALKNFGPPLCTCKMDNKNLFRLFIHFLFQLKDDSKLNHWVLWFSKFYVNHSLTNTLWNLNDFFDWNINDFYPLFVHLKIASCSVMKPISNQIRIKKLTLVSTEYPKMNLNHVEELDICFSLSDLKCVFPKVKILHLTQYNHEKWVSSFLKSSCASCFESHLFGRFMSCLIYEREMKKTFALFPSLKQIFIESDSIMCPNFCGFEKIKKLGIKIQLHHSFKRSRMGQSSI